MQVFGQIGGQPKNHGGTHDAGEDCDEGEFYDALLQKHPDIPGKDLYLALREKGILVRHFDKPALTDYNRITIGSREQMKTFITALTEILEVTP